MTFLIIPPYLLLAFFVIRRLTRDINGSARKWSAVALLSFLFYLPLGWDVILGRAYFHYLCATQGGVHVYSKVELGPEYWDAEGRPIFILENGELDTGVLKGKFKVIRETGRANVFPKSISVYTTKLEDAEIGKVIANRIVFFYLGGWVTRYSGFSYRGISCHRERKGLYQGFLVRVFGGN